MDRWKDRLKDGWKDRQNLFYSLNLHATIATT